MGLEAVAVSLKADAPAIIAALRRHGRFLLYHWSPTAAVPSVLQYGLLPRRELDARGIPYSPHGYGRARKEVEFGGHVGLTFMPHWGMMRGEAGPTAIFEIDASVVAIDGAFYCPDNTARNEYEFSDVSTWTTSTHLDDLFDEACSTGALSAIRPKCGSRRFPINYIRTVHFRSVDDRDEVLTEVGPIAAGLPREDVLCSHPQQVPGASAHHRFRRRPSVLMFDPSQVGQIVVLEPERQDVRDVLHERIAGALLGGAIADALGVANGIRQETGRSSVRRPDVSGHGLSSMAQTHGGPVPHADRQRPARGRLDDTQLALALARSTRPTAPSTTTSSPEPSFGTGSTTRAAEARR